MNEDDCKQAFHHLNLQPLWQEDNDSKGGANRKEDWDKEKSDLKIRIDEFNKLQMLMGECLFFK